jgi:hypothetical protein
LPDLARVLRHFGAGADTAAWRLLPVVVTSRNLLSPRVVQPEIPVVRIADLPSWVADTELPGAANTDPERLVKNDRSVTADHCCLISGLRPCLGRSCVGLGQPYGEMAQWIRGLGAVHRTFVGQLGGR